MLLGKSNQVFKNPLYKNFFQTFKVLIKIRQLKGCKKLVKFPFNFSRQNHLFTLTTVISRIFFRVQMNPGEFSQIRRRGQPFGFESSQTTTTTYSVPPPDFDQASIMPHSNSGRDRTLEFANTVRSLKGRTLNQQQPLNRSKNELLAQQNREFMTIAASIGRDIANTYTKLEKLTLLAKRRTLFDDRPAEIQELISIIKEDTSALNRQIDQLSRISKAQQQTLRSKHQATHSSTVVANLQLKLAQMTSDFKQVLEVRSENLRESKSRREQFSQGAVTKTLPQLPMNGFPASPGGGSVLAQAIQDDEASRGQVLFF